jgi:predicted AlkP superfamily pyrophosphatase or phosphodiesterase
MAAVSRLVACLLLAIACSGTPHTKPATGPKLVVLIVVDQLPMWAFDRDRAMYTGGIARMLRDGAVATGDIPYATPFTAPGHAAIGTGAPPSVHGVVGNTWYRRAEGRERDAEWDPAATVLAVGPPNAGMLSADETGSAKALRVDGIAEALRAGSKGKAHSIAIALKARAAAFVAGKRPDLAVWYEAAAGGMTTSRAYASEPPRWLVELAATKSPSTYFRSKWTPLDAGKLAAITKIPDDAPGEGKSDGLTTAFPHDLALSNAPAKAILHTPFADDIVFDAVDAAIDALELGKDDVPDLLAVSFNAHDYAGHNWGPDSWEVADLTMRLDAKLGSLFDTLDAKVGAGRWAAVLTSDHGATPVIERGKPGARRITGAEITKAIDDAVAGFTPGPYVAKVTSSNVYMTDNVVGMGRLRDAILDQAAKALVKLPNIAAAGTTSSAKGNCEQRSGLEQAICYSIFDGESGELYIVPARGSLITDYKTGTHHDAPFDDNRKVPILVLAPGVAKQSGTGSLLQVAPTVTALLGVPPPVAAKLPPLFGLR